MKNLFKSKFGTILVLLATVALAGIAIFTAFRLYKLRQEAVTPNAPTSEPGAVSVCGSDYGPGSGLIECGTQCCTEATQVCCNTGCKSKSVGCGGSSTTPTTKKCDALTFTISTTSPLPSASAEPNSCGGTCGSDSNCKSGLICSAGLCRNSSCTTDTDCVCPSSTTNPTSSSTSTPSGTQASLPQAGTSLPTILGLSVGGILLVISLLLAI